MENGTRMSAARAYLHPIRFRRNLHVVKYSRVTKILIDPLTNTAAGVEFVRGRQKYRVMSRNEVILSAGAINSPHLLSLSGIGPKTDLNKLGIPLIKDLPVGYNLMDHVALGGLTFLVDPPISLQVDRILGSAKMLYDFMRYRNSSVTIPGGSEALGFIDLENPNDPDGYPDFELLLASGTIAGEPTIRASFNIDERVYNRVYRQLENKDGFMVFPMIMRPKSRGRVYLNSSNPLSLPLIDMGYFSDESDLDIIVKGVNMMIELAKTPAFQEVNTRLHSVPLPGCEQHTFASDDYWKCHARHLTFTIYHQSGTCTMGPVDDGTAVVDPRLKVYGVNNLRVVDASIFPVIPVAHPNAAILMIAEKASDMIKQEWKVM